MTDLDELDTAILRELQSDARKTNREVAAAVGVSPTTALDRTRTQPRKFSRISPYRLESLLGEFHLGHLRDAPATALSGGERRRCEIARALAADPSIMLLDEPFAGIDPIAVIEIQRIIGFLKARGIGVLITDHNVRETLEIIDRAYILHDGQVLMEGAPRDIVAHEGVRRVYLGERFSL